MIIVICYYVLVLFFFFFFKQKTAYDMRISDWSSDVCSSDLYDLCEQHSERLSAPRGCDVLRLAADPSTLEPSSDALLALADAVREAARPVPASEPEAPAGLAAASGRVTTRRCHLRSISSVCLALRADSSQFHDPLASLPSRLCFS